MTDHPEHPDPSRNPQNRGKPDNLASPDDQGARGPKPAQPIDPIKDTRFKPGQSGNPKGRPRKVPRAEIPSQIGRDVRKIMRMKVAVNTPEGIKMLTLDQANYYRIFIDGAAGKISQQRQALKLIREAFEDNLINDSVLRFIDRYAPDYQDLGSKEPRTRNHMVSLAARSKR